MWSAGLIVCLALLIVNAAEGLLDPDNTQLHRDVQTLKATISKLQEKLTNVDKITQQQATQINNHQTHIQQQTAQNTNLQTNIQQQTAQITNLQTNIQQQTAQITNLQTNIHQLLAEPTGSVYVRWGRKDCSSNGTEIVYTGIAGGGYYGNPGRNANPVCVPHDPDLGPTNSEGYFGTIQGMEYETNAFGSNLVDKDVPCAVCRARQASSVLMIPGRSRCYGKWKTEYTGNLMSGHHGHAGASHSICVDSSPDMLEAGARNDNGYLLYVVKAYCGSLKCPPYVQNSVFKCVVCSL